MKFLLVLFLLNLQVFNGQGSSTILSSLAPPAEERSTTDVQCGRQLVRDSKVVNGQNAYEGEFPWMVSIRHKKRHLCGGSLIAEKWVLSAAHCFNDARRSELSSYRVVIGGRQLSETSADSVTRGIAKIISHERFSPSLYINDIALVKLTEPVAWSRFIQPVCLATSDPALKAGNDAIVIGWGFNAEPSFDGHLMDALQKVTLKIVDNKQCASWYQNAGFAGNVRPNHLCAGFKEGNKDSCDGDSGGPLVMKENGRYTLIGVVSSGIGCARPLLPGLYTNVAIFRSWILNRTSERS